MQGKVVKGDLRDVKFFKWVIVLVQSIIESSLWIALCKKNNTYAWLLRQMHSQIKKNNKMACSELGMQPAIHILQ